MDAQAAYDAVADRFLPDPAVAEGRMMSSQGLKVQGKFFAWLYRGQLVVKLPKERCTALVDGGATRFDPGGSRPMKEWIVIPADRSEEWPALADEALAFVRSIAASITR